MEGEVKSLEYAGYLIGDYVGYARSHPLFSHIKLPPEGYIFTQNPRQPKPKEAEMLAQWIRCVDPENQPERSGFPFVDSAISALIPVVREAIRYGARLEDVREFLGVRGIVRGALPALNAQLPLDKKLALIPTVPFCLGSIPWAIEIEDSTTLFFPYIQNGKTSNVVELSQLGCYPVLKALLESDRCRAIITHVKSTADSLPLIFQSGAIEGKVFHSPIGTYLPKLPKEKFSIREGGQVNLLFTNSWHQGDVGFYLRGGHDLTDAFRILSDRYSNLHLTMRTAIPKNLKKEQLDFLTESPKVTVIDKFLSEEDLHQVMLDADVYLLPSARIHVMSIVKAFAYGLPIVTSDGWGISEYVEDGWNGFVIPGRYGICSWIDSVNGMLREDYSFIERPDGISRNIVEGIVRAVSNLVENPNLRIKLGRQARLDAEQKFSIHQLNANLKVIFDQIFEDKRSLTPVASDSDRHRISETTISDRSVVGSLTVTQPQSSKQISFVVTGRNDNYMGNFKYRLATCLNYLSRNLNELGRLKDTEILITDWNSDVPLCEVLNLSSEAAKICRFIIVPPEVARAVQRPDQVFFPYCAINVSLRRAVGEYVMLFDADSLMPRHSLRALFDILDGSFDLPLESDRTFFVFSRYHVPWEMVQREPSLTEWDRYLLTSGSQLQRDPGLPGLGIACAGQMMHRSLWHACRGYNEHFLVQGWGDAEITLRLSQHYPWIDMLALGAPLYHMEHWSRNKRVAGAQEHNPPHVSSTLAVNDEHWGLGNRTLPERHMASSASNGLTAPSSHPISDVLEPNPPISVPLATPLPLDSAAEARTSDRNIRSDEYIHWLCWILGGWLRPENGNLRAFDCAIRHMPAQGAVVEIGSFLGLSTNILTYSIAKHHRSNPVFNCDPWAFEGVEQKIGGYFDASSRAYRDYSVRVYRANAEVFSANCKPYTVEAFSEDFFRLWTQRAVVKDLFGRQVRLGGAIAFAYVDGNHTYEATKADFLAIHPHLLPGGFILFDDSAESGGHEGANRAALEVARDPHYEVIFKTPNYFFRKRMR